jgi:hypothetical protein
MLSTLREWKWDYARGTVLVVVALAAAAGFADQASEERELPKALPEPVATQWRDAGAKVGGWMPVKPTSWMRVDTTFGPSDYVTYFEAKPGYLPACNFPPRILAKGVLAKLPDPGVPFAVNLGRTSITDAHLKELAHLKSVQALFIHSTKITDAGLKELAGSKGLRALSIGSNAITDAGLKELAGLKDLRWLSLHSTQITDAGLKELAALTSLESLHLGGTNVTGAGLKELTGLKKLEALRIARTQLTDAELKELAGLASVQAIDLRGTDISDAALAELSKLKALHTVYLAATKVTGAGIQKLRQSLPDYKVIVADGEAGHIKDWGTIIDPEGDCRFVETEGKLMVKVPGTYHDFHPERGYKNNGPRVSQQVMGDFRVEVNVAGQIVPDKGMELPGNTVSFRAASLLVWQNSNSFVRLDCAGMWRDGKLYTYAYYHVFRDGKRIVEQTANLRAGQTTLSIERKGDLILSSVKQGKEVRPFPEQKVVLPATVAVAVGAINSSKQPLEAEFSQLKITGGKPK